MRPATLAVVLIAAAGSGPARAEPAEKVAAVEFVGAEATRQGGAVAETRYSEKADDAALTRKEFADGVVTYGGQVGLGKGSQWAGIGFSVNLQPDARPADARAVKTITFKLASPTTASLRLRIIGAEEKIRLAGCYPVYVQAVTKDLTEYTIPVSKFVAEGWCAAQARSTAVTMGELVGFEIVDVAMKKAPTSFSVGTITLNP
jgi:hypothetical protein